MSLKERENYCGTDSISLIRARELGRRGFLAAAASSLAATAFPHGAAGQQNSNPKVSLGQISKYFEKLIKAQATFRQTNYDGSWATGKIYLHRPWRFRLDYDPPAQLLLMAAGQRIFIFDLRSNTGPEEYPLKWTPFYPLLAEDVDLNRSDLVSGHFGNENVTWINLRDPGGKTNDYVSVVFRNEPLELAGWEYHASDGTTTVVVLSELRILDELPPNLFVPELEKRRHYGN
ncbi:MAG: outer membrane lipoprotein carrier protein LolA [Albidovulum sp.]|nr:outer membrane lipoprotein carrier protein LolA [Albidovulum sp.]